MVFTQIEEEKPEPSYYRIGGRGRSQLCSRPACRPDGPPLRETTEKMDWENRKGKAEALQIKLFIKIKSNTNNNKKAIVFFYISMDFMHVGNIIFVFL